MGSAKTVSALAVIALATALMGLSACPALIVGGLGYQAYKYEEGHPKTAPQTTRYQTVPNRAGTAQAD